MLDENETLFVEHKSSVEGEGYKVAEAVASFANTLGGWVLIGVRDGKPTGWAAPESLTDRMRQILDRWLDPLPAFATRIVDCSGDNIGLVRVYESTDTPHVLRNGKVVVRSVAEVSNRARVYRAGGVDTQLVLRELADRGHRAVREATEKLGAAATPLIHGAIGLTSEWGVLRLTSNHIGLRAVPLAGDRLREIAVSRSGRRLLEAAVRDLAQYDGDAEPRLLPRASGLISELQQLSGLVPGMVAIPRTVVAAADAAGAVAVGLRFHQDAELRSPPALSLDQVRDGIIDPLLRAVVGILVGAELFGRSILELRIGAVGHALTIEDSPENREFPVNLPLGDEISLPIAADGHELHSLANRWRDDLGRQVGFQTLRD